MLKKHQIKALTLTETFISQIQIRATRQVLKTKSINRVKQELQTVIDLMGPSTPQLHNNASSDADNVESISTSTSTKLSKKRSKSITPSPDSSLQEKSFCETTYEATDFSLAVDKNTTSEFDFETDDQVGCSPPHVVPPHICINPGCLCAETLRWHHQHKPQGLPEVIITNRECNNSRITEGNKSEKNIFVQWFKNKTLGTSKRNKEKYEYYQMDANGLYGDNNFPKRLVFDLVDETPKCQTNYTVNSIKEIGKFTGGIKIPEKVPSETISKTKESKNLDNAKISSIHEVDEERTNERSIPNATFLENSGTTKVDVYYFDHGNSKYLRTTDSPPVVMTEVIAEKTEAFTTKFWASLFGTGHVPLALGATCVLQFFRFILYSFVRPLTVGITQLTSDYFFKPFLATIFNALIQPPLIFLYNIATSIRDICGPLAEGFGYFIREFSVIVKAIRLVEIKQDCKCKESAKCERSRET